MELLVDPILYTVPDVIQEPEAHVQFVASLSSWTEEFCTNQHNFYVWSECMDALNAAGCFPYPKNLRKVWALAEEKVISPDLVWTFCKKLFEVPNLEDLIIDPLMRDMLIDEKDFQIRPELLDRLPPSVANTFQRALGWIAYVMATQNNSPAADLMLVTHPLPLEQKGSLPMAEIVAYVVTDGHDARIEAELPLIMEPADLAARQTLAELWQEPEKAIKWMAQDMVREGVLPKTTKLAPFHVHDTFVESIRRYGFATPSSRLHQIFRKSVLLLSGNISPDPDAHHTLDKHQQQVVGKWGAWRLHVTGSPIAIRLHYWRRGNEYILMHVVPFQIMKIDDPPF